MWDAEKRRIIQRYDARLAEHGAQFAALASGTEERRSIRFRVLTEVGITPGDSVLDLGCGFGDFAAFLDAQRIEVDYAGYDINPRLIEEARRRHPSRQFAVRDVLEDEFPQFDFIVSSSCFNLRMLEDDNYQFVERILTVCHSHARKGVSIDFLSSYVDFPSAEGFHYQPERVFAIAKRLTKRVTLRHDYPLFEFNVYLYPDFAGWAR
jgi:ubiquinone/menaquinone biosynthesis C-methylase UbiE